MKKSNQTLRIPNNDDRLLTVYKKIYNGPCELNIPINPVCQSRCTYDYRPICAESILDERSTVQDFSNSCDLGNYNCEHLTNRK